MDVFWFSGTAREGFTVHHERDVHVETLRGRVVIIEGQAAFVPENLLGLAHRNCTRGVATQTFPFNPFDHMTRNEIAIYMKKAVRSAIRGARDTKGKAKKATAAA